MLLCFWNVRSLKGSVVYVFYMKIELNIKLICIVMKLKMKIMVAFSRGVRDESEVVLGLFWGGF